MQTDCNLGSVRTMQPRSHIISILLREVACLHHLDLRQPCLQIVYMSQVKYLDNPVHLYNLIIVSEKYWEYLHDSLFIVGMHYLSHLWLWFLFNITFCTNPPHRMQTAIS